MSRYPTLYLSQTSRETTVPISAVDEYGQVREGYISAEYPLTIYLDKREILTLMTMGSQPELLVLGWLRNQNLIRDIRDIKAIQVDWETESVAVTTYQGIAELDAKLEHKTVTTGCGQGTVFGDVMTKLDQLQLPAVTLHQSQLYATLQTLSAYNEIYRRAGAVHGCALCAGTQILSFVEDVGRHNAVDTIAGYMWLHDMTGADKLFYTTGRLTSEMVIKVAQMGIPILLSRSGVTQMGLEMARRVGVLMIARVKGQHFQIYHGAERMIWDAIPAPRPAKDVAS